MVAIKRKMLQSVNSLIVFLISLMGFTASCEEQPAEYGTPYAFYIVIGGIKSAETQQPIPDIIVEMRRVMDTGEGQPASRLINTNFSDFQGRYGLSETDASHDDRTYKIKFTDTNGPINGEYQTLDTVVVFQDPKFINGDGSWYLGTVEKELNVELKPKE